METVLSRRWRMYIWIGSSLAIASALLLAAETDFEVEMGTEPTAKPWVVAIQPGHFEIKRLPDELAHIRGDTETSYGPVCEADINKFVADALIQRIVAQTDRPDNYTSYRSLYLNLIMIFTWKTGTVAIPWSKLYIDSISWCS